MDSLFFFSLMREIKISEYTYNLAESKIAKYPLKKRDESKLLIYKNREIFDDKFKNIEKFLQKNTLLVINNTKVIHARLNFRKKTGAKIEIFCLNPHNPTEYNLAFSSKNSCQWECIVGNLKKWKSEDLSLEFWINSKKKEKLIAEKISKKGNNQIIKFKWNSDLTFGEILNSLGEIPIPPYLKRKSEENDKKRYQTIYSQAEGSVAAPTAGLHFTDEIIKNLTQKKNIKTAKLTLHVGAGTFKPVKEKYVNKHQMHTEFFVVSKKNIEKIYNNLGNITSVGTTSMRTLESIYQIGLKLLKKEKNFNFIDQWEAYEWGNENISVKKSLKAIINYLEKNKLNYLKAKTKIIIVPGYKFKIVNYLITNFHQPGSTLLLLVAAFTGEDWKKIYDYALNNNFRFLSYGDSSLLYRNKNNKAV